MTSRRLLDVAKEFAFRPIVVGGHEAWRVADLLAERDITVVLHKMTPGAERGTEGTRLCADIARRMHDRDITFCLSQGDLLTQAQHAVAMGLPLDAAIRAITLTPAKVLQIDDRVGSIAVGKDADFVALNGDPLQFTSAIGWVMIDGKVQFQQEIN
jgi:imidazolonepropionase-like amidohydrolase